MGCTATGVSDDASPSAPITTTEALTYTGDAAKGFFRSVSLVGDSRELMTHTPGVLKGDGVYTTGGEVVVSKSQSETRVKTTGSATRTGVSTASSLTGSGSSTTKMAAATSVASVVVVLTTTTLSSKGSEAVESVSVVTDSVDVESTASTTPFEVSSSASGTVTPIPTISTSSGSRVDRVHEVLMAFTILAVVVVVGDSIS